jgi:uncharacterized protein YjbI with pentapeptide repeats
VRSNFEDIIFNFGLLKNSTSQLSNFTRINSQKNIALDNSNFNILEGQDSIRNINQIQPNQDYSFYNFTELDLTGVNFGSSKFTGTIFKRTNLSKATFDNASFNFSDMTAADLTDARFLNSNFENPLLNNTIIDNSVFDGSKFKNVDFRDSKLGTYSAKNIIAENLTGNFSGE